MSALVSAWRQVSGRCQRYQVGGQLAGQRMGQGDNVVAHCETLDASAAPVGGWGSRSARKATVRGNSGSLADQGRFRS